MGLFTVFIISLVCGALSVRHRPGIATVSGRYRFWSAQSLTKIDGGGSSALRPSAINRLMLIANNRLM
jgi:hypothetical protein